MIQRNWQSLIKTNKIVVEHGDDPSRVAMIIAEPLERGFGLTLGECSATDSVVFFAGGGDYFGAV